ncbi:MAG: 1,4-alpha-glucan branching protein GlgB [Steroidobacteraceae bacterium]|jgi:1,4-alpha-glucan branching enzyme|nr:1,4-alpha-glucan branching protein GlgB [Steroidobacteraceae bacterium]
MPQPLPDPLDSTANAVTSDTTDGRTGGRPTGGEGSGEPQAASRFHGLDAGLAAALRGLGHDLDRLAAGSHHDPHGVLGPHRLEDGRLRVLVHLPMCRRVALEGVHEATRLPGTDFFAWAGEAAALPRRYRVSWEDSHGARQERIDPYAFPEPQLSDHDLYLFNAGRHVALWNTLGARPMRLDGVEGTLFAVWAPDAVRVSVVGPFCQWDGRRHPMRSRGASGTWELFLPGVGPHELYKYEIRNRVTGELLLKSDPLARATERRPATASVVAPPTGHAFADRAWMDERVRLDWLHAPMSIYELHLGSWRRGEDDRFLTYREIADHLVPYVRELGFTHVELLPITEHPLDDSWGYQATGFFAPTSRHGSADDLRYFVDRLHEAGIGVLLDWVPGHFPRDAHGLARFDGSACYEYPDPRKAEHKDWGTLVFNYERHEVRSFLLSSALYWLEEFHFDGLRVDAVASMLYLDFSRRQGDFVPNKHGGNHNLEAIEFIRELNAVVHGRCPGAVVIAEESTDWAMVSRPTHDGGLGFSMKWNMGWMHDTLEYFALDPVHRRHHHDRLTFGMMYAYSENFVLPLSHDEVVHLKKPLVYKMPGDRWQQFANLRLLFAYQWTFPGKKLLFMGGEFAQTTEWNSAVTLPWWLLEHAEHRGVKALVADLNRLYVQDPRLHRHEFEPEGFRWVDCEDRAQSVLSFLRLAGGEPLLVVLNFTPVPRYGYRVGVPRGGAWRECLNSDSSLYGGGNLGNGPGPLVADPVPMHGQSHSLALTLPPLAALVLTPT